MTERTDAIVPSPAERRGFSVVPNESGGGETRRYLLPRGLLRGPAAYPELKLEVREMNGHLQVRKAERESAATGGTQAETTPPTNGRARTGRTASRAGQER